MHFGDGDLGTWPIDTFGFEVDLLVTSVYTVTINGIETWDCEQKRQFQIAKLSFSEEGAQEIERWNEQVTTLRCHAGNMAFVSLIAMFEHWLVEFEKGLQERNVRPVVLERPAKRKTAKNRKTKPAVVTKFEQIEELLKISGPLSSHELQEAVTARNAIIHHRSAVEYRDKNTPKEVQAQFVSEIGTIGFQVGITEEVLSQYSSQIKQQAERWFSEIQTRLRRQR